MQLKKTVILISAFYSGALLAAQPSMNVEEKLAQLEAQIQELKQQQAAATQAAPAVVVQSEEPVSKTAPPKLTLSGFGDIKFYGDVEFNMDAASKTGSLTSVKQSANSDWAPGDKERWDINGRILLGFDGYRKMDNGNFAGFSVQPLGDLAGQMYLDDAVFFFGTENDWEIKVGRFEAYDMFPLNQDTFVEYSGNTADDLYSDGYGYIYMLKEGRGRTDSGGNFLMNKTLDNWYFELNTLFKDGSDLYVDQRYHGANLRTTKMWPTCARSSLGRMDRFPARLLWRPTWSTTLMAIAMTPDAG